MARHAFTQPFYVRDQTGKHDPYERANLELAMVVFNKLQSEFPGHPWKVIPDHEGGLLSVYLQGFSNWGFHIHLARLLSDTKLDIVRKAGGELLERMRLPRNGTDIEAWAAAYGSGVINLNKRPG